MPRGRSSGWERHLPARVQIAAARGGHDEGQRGAIETDVSQIGLRRFASRPALRSPRWAERPSTAVVARRVVPTGPPCSRCWVHPPGPNSHAEDAPGRERSGSSGRSGYQHAADADADAPGGTEGRPDRHAGQDDHRAGVANGSPTASRRPPRREVAGGAAQGRRHSQVLAMSTARPARIRECGRTRPPAIPRPVRQPPDPEAEPGPWGWPARRPTHDRGVHEGSSRGNVMPWASCAILRARIGGRPS